MNKTTKIPEGVSHYSLTYKGVLCFAVNWNADPYIFYFKIGDIIYSYKQPRYIESSADTDHIRIAIDMFLEYLSEKEENPDPLTEVELQQMHGQPAWCKETKCWGLICVEDGGQWANIPFFHFYDPNYRVSATFTYNIKERGLTLYRQPMKDRK